MNPIKVLYDHQSFNYLSYGGVSRYTFELLKQAVKNETVDVHLFAGIYRPEWKMEQLKGKRAKFYGLRRPTRGFPNKVYGIVNRILFSGYSVTQKFDVYHPTLYQYLYPFFKGKFVYTVHDLLGDFFPDVRGMSTLPKLIRYATPKASKILTVSNHTKKDLMERIKIPEEKIKVTYLANPLRLEVKEEQLVKGDYLLHVGGRGGHKNFNSLLFAYNNSKFLKDNFKLVNFGMSKYSREEKDYLSKNNLMDKVIFLSGGDKLAANLYKYASLFVLPSLYEGFGIPPLEAMYYGCPVVVSNRTSVPEVVGDAGLYFDPENEEELINSVEKVLTDTSLRQSLIDKGYSQEKKFSWEKCFNETLEVYLE